MGERKGRREGGGEAEGGCTHLMPTWLPLSFLSDGGAGRARSVPGGRAACREGAQRARQERVRGGHVASGCVQGLTLAPTAEPKSRERWVTHSTSWPTEEARSSVPC